MITIARIAKWLRHRLLKPTYAGSNPAAGANPIDGDGRCVCGNYVDDCTPYKGECLYRMHD